MEETITVCADCGEEVIQATSGTEGWSICTGCRNIEGDTREISLEEYDASTAPTNHPH